VKLKPNRRKILESILFLIAEGERQGNPLTQYQIVKSLFLADTAHLNAYGRPVTFDNYSALQFGPVPVEAYDMLKPAYPWGERFGQQAAPWTRRQVSETAFQYIQPSRPADERALSKSDAKALIDGLKVVRELGFGGVRDQTHLHPAYVEAWDSRGAARGKAMDYAKLFDEPDTEGADAIAYASAHS
jgi:hypothetical protein